MVQKCSFTYHMIGSVQFFIFGKPVFYRHNLTVFVQRQGLVLDHFHQVEEEAHFYVRVWLQKVSFVWNLVVFGDPFGVADLFKITLQLIESPRAFHVILIIERSLQDKESCQVLKCLVAAELQICSINECESSLLDIKIDDCLLKLGE